MSISKKYDSSSKMFNATYAYSIHIGSLHFIDLAQIQFLQDDN